MYRPALMRLAFGVGVLIVLMLALTSCGSESSQQEAKARPLPEDATALSPGEYHSVKFKPSLSFRVGKGWLITEPQLPDFIEVGQPGEGGWILFANVKEVYKAGTTKVVKATKDLIGWFQDHAYLKTSKPEPVREGGVKEKQLDVVVEDLPEDV